MTNARFQSLSFFYLWWDVVLARLTRTGVGLESRSTLSILCERVSTWRDMEASCVATESDSDCRVSRSSVAPRVWGAGLAGTAVGVSDSAACWEVSTSAAAVAKALSPELAMELSISDDRLLNASSELEKRPMNQLHTANIFMQTRARLFFIRAKTGTDRFGT